MPPFLPAALQAVAQHYILCMYVVFMILHIYICITYIMVVSTALNPRPLAQHWPTGPRPSYVCKALKLGQGVGELFLEAKMEALVSSHTPGRPGRCPWLAASHERNNLTDANSMRCRKKRRAVRCVLSAFHFFPFSLILFSQF